MLEVCVLFYPPKWSALGCIKPSRGLRQGDPLSPYLFLLCAMGLQGLVQKAKMEGSLKGVAICRQGLRVSHLFYADDSLLFCHATEDECQRILDILVVYERGTGQKINREKTNIFFSSNTSHQTQTRIQQFLGIPKGVEETTGLERKTSICCGQGGSYKSCYSSHSNLHHELLQASKRPNKITRSPYKKILVGLH